jgi:tetratricopeptide (TPR) repeat protein
VADLRAGEPGGVTRAKLRARVARGLPDGEAARVTSFLAEVVGVRDERARSVQLDAAREDPRLMGEQIRRAFEDFVENELRAAPLAIVLDDLQWGDPPTLALFARLLRNLAHRPLAVIGLTRPAPARSLGAPWDGATLLELEALAPDDAARLATRALAAAGRACDPDEVTRIVDRGRGNPLCLEELVRGAIQGALDETPTTVMAMAQARIVELPAELRRVLRAASVFGDELWVPGVERLLGEAAGGVRVGDALARLSARGLLEPRPASRYPDHAAWSFRHETIRASAYEMLTERDRRLGHELAAEWLEEVGEHDPVRMIAHHERAGRPVRAIPWYRAAAEIALEAEALEAALDLSERGVRAGARGPVLGALRLVQAQAWSWSAKADEARRAARSAMSALLAGSEAWYRALEVLAFASLHPDVEDTLADTERELAAGAAAPTRGWTRACARLAVANFQAGHGERAARLLAMVEAAPAELAEAPDVAAAIARARASRAARDGDDAACLVHLRRAAAHHRESGSERRASIERLNSAALEIALGLYEEAEAQLGEALWEAERVGLAIVRDAARLNLGHALARTGRVDEALAQLARAAPSLREQGDPRLMGAAALYEGRAHLAGGALEEAERCTRQACELLAAVPPVRPVAEAQLARILAARGATEEALALATGAARALEAGHEIESDHGLVRLALAEALEAAGRREEAARAYAAAARAVRERAATIVDPGWRRAFLERVEEHALALRAAAGVS